jgi:glutamate-ammonia-ligase adenylyltransferase
VAQDVAHMRARLAEAKPAHSLWDTKSGPGRLMDIELAAQYCALRAASPARRVEAHLRAVARAGIITPAQEADLLHAYRLCWRMQATGRLLADQISDMADLGVAGQRFILAQAEAASTDALSESLTTAFARASDILDTLFALGDPQP